LWEIFATSSSSDDFPTADFPILIGKTSSRFEGCDLLPITRSSAPRILAHLSLQNPYKPPKSDLARLTYLYYKRDSRAMDHEALQRKLAHLDEQIHAAQTASLHGSAVLSGVTLTLDDAIRVAANIRKRLAGVPRPAGRQSHQMARSSDSTAAND